MQRDLLIQFFWIAALGGSVLAQGLEEVHLFFPLGQGNAWVFKVDAPDPGPIRWEFIVLSRREEFAVVRYQVYDSSIVQFRGYLEQPID